MSMIGDFGLCSGTHYHHLLNCIKNNLLDEAEDVLKMIHNEMENSGVILEDSKCSGEVFEAIFSYFETESKIDVRGNEDLKKAGELWREVIGGYDMVVFTEKVKLKILALENHIDDHAVSQYVSDFYARDYGDIGQTACKVLFENLKKCKDDHVLLWYLY